jgi:hypothetical protein
MLPNGDTPNVDGCQLDRKAHSPCWLFFGSYTVFSVLPILGAAYVKVHFY